MTPEPPSRGRSAKLAEAALLGLVLVVAMEATMRLEDWVRYGAPFQSNFTDQAELIVRDKDGMHGRPNARFRKFRLNNFGFRGPDMALRPGPGAIRVFTLGASETFGFGESPDREYPRQLADSLAVRVPLLRQAGVSGFEVVNGAMLGMSLPTATQDTRMRLTRFAPSFLVAYPTPVHYLFDERPQAAVPDSSDRDEALSLHAFQWRAKSRLIDQVKMLLPVSFLAWLRARETARIQRSHGAGWVFSEVPQERLEWYEEDLRRFVGTSRAIGAEPILMGHVNIIDPSREPDPSILANWRKSYPKAGGTVLPDFDRAARRVMCQVASDSSATFVDPEPLLGHDRKAFFSDASHFTDRGAAVIAGLLARTLETRLGGRPTQPAGSDCATR